MSSVPKHSHVHERKIGVVLPAAGHGLRLGSSLPKQFLFINGQPLLSHTINSFLGVPGLVKIVVVISDEDDEMFNDHVAPLVSPELRDSVVTVIGGQQRHYSISSGIRQLKKDGISTIVIHDAVRPLIDLKFLEKLINAATKHGSAGPVTPLTSTVVSISDDGLMDTALERSCYRDSQMPQVFKANVIIEAYEKCSKRDLDFGTECLDLVKKYTSSDVKLIEGNGDHLWKVTYRKDLASASYCLDDQVSEVLLRHDSNDLHRPDKKRMIEKLELVIKSYSSFCDKSRRLSLNRSRASSNEFNRSSSFEDQDTSVSIYVRFSSSPEQLECQIRDLESLVLGVGLDEPHTRGDRGLQLPKPDTVKNIYLLITSHSSSGNWQLYSEFEALVLSTKKSLPSIAIVYSTSNEGEERIKSEIRLFSLIQSLITSPSIMTGQVIIF